MNMIKEENLIISNEIVIGATVAYEDKNKKRPLVLLVMGTGKTNRDGNSFGFQTNLYKNLSNMFVNMGCVCIRYDKRDTYESTGDYNTSGIILLGGACMGLKEALLYQNYLVVEQAQSMNGIFGWYLRKVLK